MEKEVCDFVLDFLTSARPGESFSLESELNIDSIDMVRVILGLQEKFGLQFNARQMEALARIPTVKEMGHFVSGLTASRA